jgi:hypothetical protein
LSVVVSYFLPQFWKLLEILKTAKDSRDRTRRLTPARGSDEGFQPFKVGVGML